MATAVIPKSEIRRNDNIIVGFGEVPAFDCEETGRTGWGLPGGAVTFNESEARWHAGELNREIRRTMRDTKQLLTAA